MHSAHHSIQLRTPTAKPASARDEYNRTLAQCGILNGHWVSTIIFLIPIFARIRILQYMKGTVALPIPCQFFTSHVCDECVYFILNIWIVIEHSVKNLDHILPAAGEQKFLCHESIYRFEFIWHFPQVVIHDLQQKFSWYFADSISDWKSL